MKIIMMKSALLLLLVTSHSELFSQQPVIDTANGLTFQGLFQKNSRPGVACYRIPSLVTAPNGDVIAAIDERVPGCGDLKYSNDINIVIRRSRDNGRTWTNIETVIDYPLGKSASDPSMVVDETTGEIFMFFNYMDLVKEKDIYYLQYVSSRDNGETWSRPRDITSQVTKPGWHKDFKFITSGRGYQTSTGMLLHTIVNLDKGLFVFGSDDHGKTWFLLETPVRPGDESQFMELADGTWMINSRVQGAGFRYIHTSTDEGKTWITKADSSLVDPGCNAGLLRYSSIKKGASKNRLLFSNAASANERVNLAVKMSTDEGKTWLYSKTIYPGSSAYSSMTVLANGDIGLFFEKDEYSENVFVSFSLKWLTGGSDMYKNSRKTFKMQQSKPLKE